MECPECGEKTKVVETRPYAGAVYRRRKCLECNFIFYTEETEVEKGDPTVRNALAYFRDLQRHMKK